MNGFVDTVMVIGFILFMVFLLAGYHKDKYDKRDEE